MRKIINFLYNLKIYFHNLKYWNKILWKDRDWDFNYLLIIELHKLEAMSKEIDDFNSTGQYYISKDRIHVVIDILKIIITDAWDTTPPYVNIKNMSRFFTPGHKRLLLEDINKNEDKFYYSGEFIYNSRITALNEIRNEKAWKLYYKLREHYTRAWWV